MRKGKGGKKKREGSEKGEERGGDGLEGEDKCSSKPNKMYRSEGWGLVR